MNASVTIDRVRELAWRYVAAWEARDPDRIVALHTPDTTFAIHAGAAAMTGRAAVREAFAGLFEQWPGLAIEQHRLLFGPGHWVLEWTLLAGPGGMAGPREARIRCLDVVEVTAEALVARKDTFLDAADLAAVVGAQETDNTTDPRS